MKIGRILYFCVILLAGLLLCGCGRSYELAGSFSTIDYLPAACSNVQSSLYSTDPRLRANAVEVAAFSQRTEFLRRIEELTKDSYVPVRFAAVLACGQMGHASSKPVVHVALGDSDKNVQIAAAYSMFKLGNDKYFDRIKEAVRSQDMTLRANAVVLLGSSKKKDVLELLYWAKDDQQSDDKVRYQAAEGIAKLGDETIFPKLWTMVISAYPDVRVMGLSSMGALGTRKAQDVLLTKLDDEVVEVRLVAAEQLGLLKDSTGVPEVRGVFEQNLTLNMDQESRSRVLILTAMAIGNIKDNQLKGYLPALLEDKNPFVKIAASKAIFASLK